jgi:hypothetical protein
MNGPSSSVEERLERLVGDFAAPATTTALHAIERRTQVLRRRRRVGVATAAGVVGVVVAVAAGLVLRHDDPPPAEPTVEIDPVQPPTGDALTAFTVDLDGWEVTAASEEHDVPVGLEGLPPDVEVPEGVLPDPDRPEAAQVFRRPSELAGPTVYLLHTPTADNIGQTMFDVPVTIRGVSGLAWEYEDTVGMTWDPHDGHSTVWLQARGLTLDQVLEFASGLEPQDPTISSPPGPDDRFGFAPTVPVADMVEDPIAPAGSTTVDRRIVELTDGTNVVRITVDNAGEKLFEEELAGPLGATWTAVTVGDRPAALFSRTEGLVPGGDAGPIPGFGQGVAELRWLETTTARVTAEITTADEAQLDTIIDGIRPISEAEWQDILASAPSTSTRTGLVPP